MSQLLVNPIKALWIGYCAGCTPIECEIIGFDGLNYPVIRCTLMEVSVTYSELLVF